MQSTSWSRVSPQFSRFSKVSSKTTSNWSVKSCSWTSFSCSRVQMSRSWSVEAQNFSGSVQHETRHPAQSFVNGRWSASWRDNSACSRIHFSISPAKLICGHWKGSRSNQSWLFEVFPKWWSVLREWSTIPLEWSLIGRWRSICVPFDLLVPFERPWFWLVKNYKDLLLPVCDVFEAMRYHRRIHRLCFWSSELTLWT